MQSPTPPAAPVIAGQGPAGPFASRIGDLAAQLGNLAEQRGTLEQQRAVLQQQMVGVPGRSEARQALQLQRAQVDAQINQVQAQMAGVQAAIMSQAGLPGQAGSVGVPPWARGAPRMPSRNGFEILFIFALLMPISIGIMRRLTRTAPKIASPAPRSDMDSQRLERLEQAVDSIAIEVERISESQRFLTKVLGSNGARSNGDPGVVGAEPTPRALGAGPMEPIRVPEREAVRPSITPR